MNNQLSLAARILLGLIYFVFGGMGLWFASLNWIGRTLGFGHSRPDNAQHFLISCLFNARCRKFRFAYRDGHCAHPGHEQVLGSL